jgi:hypothetical protein
MWWILISLFIDPIGLVTLNDRGVDGPGAGNLLLHTGLYYVAAHKEKVSTKRTFSEVVKSSEVKGYPGLYWRSPYKIGDRQEHDDYLGLAAASYFYDQSIAKDILAHGQKFKWCYNSQNPEKFDPSLIHDRFPGQIAFYRMSAGEAVSVWELLPLVIRAVTMSYSSAGDSAIHSYLMFSVGMDAYPLLFYPAWWISGKPLGKKFEPYLGIGHPLNEITK